MDLYHRDDIDKALNDTWAAYLAVNHGIDCLENIGLSVDGNSESTDDMSVLFGALTAAGNAILALFGIPDEEPYSDEGHMLLSDTADSEKSARIGAVMPQSLRRGLQSIADTAHKKNMLPLPENASPYEVTVSLTGGITAYAGSVSEAMDIVNKLPVQDMIRAACWNDGPEATDAYENP